MRQPPDYDVISGDALASDAAFAGNIYSVEYFELLKSRLRPSGVVATWCPTARVLDTFVKVFPYVAFAFEQIHVVHFGPDLPRDQLVDVNRDLFPLDQFQVSLKTAGRFGR